METLQIGRAKLTWLKGGVNFLDGGAMFGVVPKALWQKKYPSNEKNQIELRTDPILLQLDDRYFLIDSGIGNGKFTEKQIRNFGVLEESYVEEGLRELNLSTDDINGILMTHLHFDHASGLSRRIGEGKYQSIFPNATIYTSAIEWNEMRNPNIRSVNTYWESNWQPIEHQVETFADEIEIVKGLKLIYTGGHSDGHAIVVYDDGDACFIHMADLMPTHAHQNKLWAMAYDDYPVTSVHEKESWMEYGYQREAWYTFYHDAYYRAIKYNHAGEKVDALERVRYPY
ncbi:MBL fold metallo-hydrolase [Oceanobacillus piezotolerans]|uniref:MBL fold metallo-hydrolase n=1 Tax=Oceanobacillus piezotolerans TaxID=2448030 RepID=A0A498DC33_9BACI|nr:MBL fold metallo-hydrolase [Oceanobacillus piezotolerans]RLL47792.1 MBL fold metallo-hydrolase [Oceanobacillus piezotolerans]